MNYIAIYYLLSYHTFNRNSLFLLQPTSEFAKAGELQITWNSVTKYQLKKYVVETSNIMGENKFTLNIFEGKPYCIEYRYPNQIDFILCKLIQSTSFWILLFPPFLSQYSINLLGFCQCPILPSSIWLQGYW